MIIRIAIISLYVVTFALAQTDLAQAAGHMTGRIFGGPKKGYGNTFQNPSHTTPNNVNNTTTRSNTQHN